MGRIGFCAALAAMVLNGCATQDAMPKQALPQPLAEKKCAGDRIATVSLEDSLYITVFPEPIYACKKMRIYWNLDASATGWVFATNGIAFKDAGEFTNCGGAGTVSFHCDNEYKTKKTPLRYTVTLQKPGSGEVKSVDPSVVNE